MKKLLLPPTAVLSIIIAAAVIATPALATGLDSGTTAITDFKTWIYGALAIGSIIYLLFQVLQAFGQKATWVDVLHSAGWVAVGGGTPALVTYLWGVFA